MTNKILKNKKTNRKKITKNKKKQIPEINFFCPSERSEESLLTAVIIFRSFTALRSLRMIENTVKSLKINQ
ncbi:hypothetical protein LA303_11200 [Candidatus Sulfidibacterium hydrothermale]|uniref:hypothetical protein n=1 Tax=Candidatus Sulfidibacterium hydrothermale TaxID=2875962 RepID=UPI001F0ADF0C|nr:hypothetical protein [Candidatus Sulfidibacterium hydrothermale]UBM61965.1 hypothetical protein LA303_11200 [Candidatus Sulfidibacterium hydrothermale]